MTIAFKPAVFFSLFLLFIISNGFTCAQETQGREREAPTASTQDSGLRGVFLGKDSDPVQSHRVVGRLAILLKTNESVRRVRSDYSFHSGDRFRFEVTANQDGWLYVMHSVPGSDWQQLWPSKADRNKVQSGQSYQVPPAPGIFIFDKDTGNESFYVVIRSDGTPPFHGRDDGSAVHAHRPTKAEAQSSKPPPGEMVNFLIRDPFGESTRGVTFDPGKEDGDPYLYFSAALEDSTKTAKIKFQLRHTD
jgi:hypothetical protein